MEVIPDSEDDRAKIALALNPQLARSDVTDFQGQLSKAREETQGYRDVVKDLLKDLNSKDNRILELEELLGKRAVGLCQACLAILGPEDVRLNAHVIGQEFRKGKSRDEVALKEGPPKKRKR